MAKAVRKNKGHAPKPAQIPVEPAAAAPQAGSGSAQEREITLNSARRFWLITLGSLAAVIAGVQLYGYLTAWGDPERLAQRYFNQAQQLTLAKRYDAAVRTYDKILNLKISDDERRQAVIGIADLLKEQKAWDKAIVYYRRLQEQDPASVLAAWAGLQIAESQLDAGQPEQALASYGQVIAAFPKTDWEAEARLGEGLVLEKQERYREAIERYQAFAGQYAGGFLAADALVRAGKCYELLGDPASARRMYQTVLTAYPSSTWDDAKSRLEMLDRGKPVEGVRTWGNGK